MERLVENDRKPQIALSDPIEKEGFLNATAASHRL